MVRNIMVHEVVTFKLQVLKNILSLKFVMAYYIIIKQ